MHFSDAINFIDYEYADYNFQAFDIGDHFCEYAGKTTTFSIAIVFYCR